MNNKNLREMIQQLRSLSQTKEQEALLSDFETFISLTEKKGDPGSNQEIERARSQCYSSIEKVLTSFGLTPETMQQYMENPNNFSGEEWQKIQGLKEEYLEIMPPKNKKIKNQLRRV